MMGCIVNFGGLEEPSIAAEAILEDLSGHLQRRGKPARMMIFFGYAHRETGDLEYTGQSKSI